ncbi:hypothetical protein SNEBB_001492 [Seison nebaliae]|nr:hypothetical protein SNEBB_001492 [Seison nebaliae]
MDKRRTATLNDLLRLSTNQTELERNRKNEKCVTALKKLGKRIDFAKEAGDQEKFLLGNDLVSRDTNIWITLVAHLFLDPLDRNGEFIGIVMYPDMETEYIRTETEYFPMVPPQLIDVMVHIPPLKLLIVQFGTEIVEEKYYDISKSFLEYMDSIQSRTFNERVGKDLYWIREKAAEVIHRYGYPKVVITPERSVDGNVNAVQLSVETHMGLTRRIMDAIRRVRAEPLITLEQLQNHHPLTPLRDLLFSRYSPRLSAHYWNDDGFSKMRLFRNFINDKEGDNYLLFALQLEIDTQHYRMIPKTSLPELCEKEIEYFNRTFLRTIDYLRDITHYEESLPNNEIIVNYVKSILKSPIEYETLANVDKFHQMRYLQRQIPFTPHFDTERPRYRPGHAMVMIRTFNNNWHVVDNDHIYRVERPWFFLQTDNGFSDIANMYWHEERSYDLKEDLKQYMKPIISKDYDHKDGMMLYH